MIYVKRAAMRAMSANQAQAQAQVNAQASQLHADANQQAQTTEIKDVTMTDANTENAPGEGEKVTPNAGPLLIFRSEWRDCPVHDPNRGSVGNCGCICSPSWCLGSHRGSEPDSEDSIPTLDPLHGNVG